MAGRTTVPVRLVVGAMTGTSLDGLDLALVRIHGCGLTMTAELVKTASAALGRLAAPLRQLADQQPMAAGAIAMLSRDFSRFHATAIRRLIGRSKIDFACIHGQTIYHTPPVSWQLLTPAVISQAIAAPVVSDLRAADLAAGGEGAPITPLADQVLFGRAGKRQTVINLGGFCNLTRLPPGSRIAGIRGGDVCACNQILDGVARAVLHRAYDPGGRHASRGTADPAATADLAKRLDAQRRARRSLGTGDELLAWITRWKSLSANDLARSACAAVARVIAAAARPADQLILAGGGTRNHALVGELRTAAGIPVLLSDDLGVPAAYREAMAFAVLGALCQDQVPITLSAITGVRRPPVSGTWSSARPPG